MLLSLAARLKRAKTKAELEAIHRELKHFIDSLCDDDDEEVLNALQTSKTKEEIQALFPSASVERLIASGKVIMIHDRRKVRYLKK